jgi:hypothetical protein
MTIVLTGSVDAPLVVNLDLRADLVLIDTTDGDVTVILPAPTTCQGQPFTFKKISAESPAKVCSVVIPEGAVERIDGTTSATLATAQAAMMLQARGGDWVIMSSHLFP